LYKKCPSPKFETDIVSALTHVCSTIGRRSFSSRDHISLDDQPNHSLGLAEVSGTQSSSDAKWNNSAITYWGTTDMQGTQGTQRGYFLNDHGSAGQDRGTFEGNVSVVAGEVAVEGKWQYTGGAGDFAGITGNGTFKTRLTSPTTVEGSWQGTYELAGAAAV
jgi:hypothetical protein